MKCSRLSIFSFIKDPCEGEFGGATGNFFVIQGDNIFFLSAFSVYKIESLSNSLKF